MTSIMEVDDEKLFLSLKDTTNTCKHLQTVKLSAGFLQCIGGKFKEAEDFKCGFVVNGVFKLK